MIVLMVDVGSTYTKGTLVDTETAQVLGQGKAITTVETSVLTGVTTMLEAMRQTLPTDFLRDQAAKLQTQPGHGGQAVPSSQAGPSAQAQPATNPAGPAKLPFPRFWDQALICSSAAGGLKMVAVGLGRHLTAEAAARSALGAGARILRTYAFGLSLEDLEEIDQLQPDIILLSGGTNGGNAVSLVENASQLAKLHHRCPIVIAGNEDVAEAARAQLTDFEVTVTENTMPDVNVLNPYPARRVIRQIFMDRITRAKGLDALNQAIGPVLMPTPDAVLQAAQLLAKGTDQQAGLGRLILIDIGGATTDIHSIGRGLPDSNQILIEGKTHELRVVGLQEPIEKRTVEGDLGMRYSALSLLESAGEEALQALYPADYQAACAKRRADIRYVPDSPEEKAIDQAMARVAAQLALSRHVGQLTRDFSKGRYIYYLDGKDLSTFGSIIGTGGVLVHSEDPRRAMALEPRPLYPQDADYYVDANYLLSSMGLLSTLDPEAALTIMKKNLRRV